MCFSDLNWLNPTVKYVGSGMMIFPSSNAVTSSSSPAKRSPDIIANVNLFLACSVTILEKADRNCPWTAPTTILFRKVSFTESRRRSEVGEFCIQLGANFDSNLHFRSHIDLSNGYEKVTRVIGSWKARFVTDRESLVEA